MSLQFTYVGSFACRGRLRSLRGDCSTVGLYCVTITWQQIFKGLLQVAAVGFRSMYSTTVQPRGVTRDSGKILHFFGPGSGAGVKIF